MSAWLLARRVPIIVLTVLVVVGAALGGPRLVAWLSGTDHEFVVTAEFDDTTGLYVGNNVTYLGVPVGEVVDVEPNGRTMRATLHLDQGTQVPAEAGAEIVQGSLVTDRYIELGPAYTGGPQLRDGAHIDDDHTRAPATVDEIATALDDLVLALDADGRGGRDLGDLIATTAQGLEGNGPAINEALARGRKALAILNSKEADLKSVTTALADLVAMVSARDEVIRTFIQQSNDAVGVLSDQRGEIVATLRSFDRLVTLADEFLDENGAVLADDLAMIDDLVALVHKHQGSLEESFDVMPTMAENFARSYSHELGRLRVQFSFDAGPFNSVFTSHFCESFASTVDAQDICPLLTQPDGSGLLDPLFTGLLDTLPSGAL